MNQLDKSVYQNGRALAGWSVIEVLIGVAVIGIIVLLSAPGVNTLSQKYTMKKTSSNLLTSLTLAQGEASRRGGIARVCPSSDGNTCRSDGNWNRGWLVFLDSNANSKPEAFEILDRYGPTDERVRIQAQGAFAQRATFNVDGAPDLEGSSGEGRFRVCFADGEPGFQELQVDNNGWVEAKKSDFDCREI